MTMTSWQMVGPQKPLQCVESPLPLPGAGEVLLRVVGCGVCHTDLGFFYDGVRTKSPLPLTLGHEISGIVTAAGSDALPYPLFLSWRGMLDREPPRPLALAELVATYDHVGAFVEMVARTVESKAVSHCALRTCFMSAASASATRRCGSGGIALARCLPRRSESAGSKG